MEYHKFKTHFSEYHKKKNYPRNYFLCAIYQIIKIFQSLVLNISPISARDFELSL